MNTDTLIRPPARTRPLEIVYKQRIGRRMIRFESRKRDQWVVKLSGKPVMRIFGSCGYFDLWDDRGSEPVEIVHGHGDWWALFGKAIGILTSSSAPIR